MKPYFLTTFHDQIDNRYQWFNENYKENYTGINNKWEINKHPKSVLSRILINASITLSTAIRATKWLIEFGAPGSRTEVCPRANSFWLHQSHHSIWMLANQINFWSLYGWEAGKHNDVIPTSIKVFGMLLSFWLVKTPSATRFRENPKFFAIQILPGFHYHFHRWYRQFLVCKIHHWYFDYYDAVN